MRMKLGWHILIIVVWILGSCKPPISELEIDLSLDDLHDRQELTGGMVLDISSFRGASVKRFLLNGGSSSPEDPLQLKNPGYYRMEVFQEGSGTQNPEVLRIVLLDEERGDAEWGLNTWTPLPPQVGRIEDEEFNLIHPASSPAGVNIPLIVKISGVPGQFSHSFLARAGNREFFIKQGVGSVQIAPEEAREGSLKIDHRSAPIQVEEMNSAPLLLQDSLAADLVIPAGSYVRIEKDLYIPAGLSLLIESASFVCIAPEVNIYNAGILQISGEEGLPVTLTCSDPDAYWGGIISTGSGNRVEASHTLFSQSGFHQGGDYNYGHAHRQALFYCKQGSMELDFCYMIDHAGQVLYPINSPVKISNSLVQRAKTSGQVNGSDLHIENCIFTDFPDDSEDYRDEDNDALYLMGCNAVIRNSLFMYAKDDGLDSGGSEGGRIQVYNSHFEAIFHEGAALSSAGSSVKSHEFKGCTFTNCGQGLELGYSSPNHLVSVDSCLFQSNGIGIRYGDNYISAHHGRISVSNSTSINNRDYDIWNMLREEWSADTAKMEFTNVSVSMETPMYPNLGLYE